ncbi:MAG: glycerophosphodiester phosphodiesterase family protein [Bacillota bacterium]
MRKVLRMLGIAILIPVVLVLLVLAASAVISPPAGGKKIAREIEIPYRALVAHRGASFIAPEATEPAYLMAREMGADYLEADLQRTADGVIVVFHDDTLERTTNVATVFPERKNDLLETFTYEELLELDTGSWFNETFPELARNTYVNLNIITLEELLDIAESGSNNPGLYLETKSADRQAGYEEQIVEILRKRGWLDGTAAIANPNDALNKAVGAPTVNTASGPARVIFQSFYPGSIARLKQLAPDVPRVLLISQETESEQGWSNLLEQAAADAQGIGPVGYLGWPWKVGPAHRAGLIVHPYTINAAWQMKLLTFFGADGFFSDQTAIALEALGKGKIVDVEAIFNRIGY